jgi:hypothetical protein
MRRIALTVLLVVALAAGVPIAAARPAGNHPPAYQHFAACGLGRKAKPSHRCPAGRPKGAFFRARRGSVHYTVCVRFPSGQTLGAKEQRAERGVLYANELTSSQPGVHRITWFVKGTRVGRFFFRIGEGRS